MEMEANGERDDEQMQENKSQKPSPLENGDSVEERLQALLENVKADFSAWTSLISEIEKTSPNGIEIIQKVYDAFLSEFPLCYGYWNKYASHVACFCSLNDVEKVYERAVEAVPYSIDIWVSYCSFGMLAYEDPPNVRRLFERGFSFIGKDYLSSLLWDKYIEFEYSQKQWSRLAYVYINTLRFPTKKLNYYYMSFEKLVAISEEEMGNTSIAGPSCEMTDAEIMNVIRNLKDQHDGLPNPSMVKKSIAVGEILYHRSSQLDEKIKFYEARIQRPYFHVKPLDGCQLENWHQYLDFVVMQEDFDWTVKLYERCLIPCANYSEFWIRYVEFVEAKGGREIANHALQRALKVFFKKVPAFHLYCSLFKERSDVNGARAAFLRPHLEPDTEFIENVVREANKEKRMGSPESACMVYEKAVEMAKMNQNMQIISILYVKFARFKFMVNNDIDTAIEIFTRGIQEVPCKSIIQEMVNFISLRGGQLQLHKLDSIIASLLALESAVSQSLNSYDREEISNMFLEFVDLHGTIDEIMKAWDRHRKLFPHLMKPPIVTWHSPPVRDKPLVNGVVGRKGIFASESHQAGEGDGPDGSRTNLLDRQSLEDNISISSKGNATGKLQGDINDIKEREELIVVTEDVEKSSINDHKGGEEVVQVAEDVEMQSMPKGSDQMVEVTESLEKQSINDAKEHVEIVEVTNNEENHSILETNEPHEEAKELAHECEGAAQVPETTPGYSKVEDQVQPLLENLSINSTDNRSQRPNPTGDHNIPQEATSEARANTLLVEGNGTPSQVQLQNSPLHSVCDSSPPESRSTPQVQMQANDLTTLQQASSVNMYLQNASGAGNWPQIYYVQSSQSQQWQVNPQMQYSSAGATNTQSVVALGHPYQSQAYQIAYAYAQPQSFTHPQAQTQVNQQSIYTQNTQGIPPHISQYYQQQQQYYYLQQQNQQASQQPQPLQLQQYQHFIYMQQQQQQQLYAQQQQTYYTQQQQILQQQQFQQLPHQEQQLLLNQHQQQFFQQQQQHQQQHQQQLQQLQQQLQQLQQQQQQQQKQQQISASDAKALSSSYIQESSHAQHTSNQDGPDYSEPAITSTEKGDKFQNAEQSGPSFSVHADTPPNQ